MIFSSVKAEDDFLAMFHAYVLSQIAGNKDLDSKTRTLAYDQLTQVLDLH